MSSDACTRVLDYYIYYTIFPMVQTAVRSALFTGLSVKKKNIITNYYYYFTRSLADMKDHVI